jgi:hypothetical protein
MTTSMFARWSMAHSVWVMRPFVAICSVPPHASVLNAPLHEALHDVEGRIGI